MTVRKKVGWLIPSVLEGSGGHRTIFSHMQYLCDNGYECHAYIEPQGLDAYNTPEAKKRQITEWFGKTDATIHLGFDIDREFDLLFATVWYSAQFVAAVPQPGLKAYFIQDYEASFNPMGDGYILAEQSYQLGLTPITIGHWLSHRMATQFATPSSCFDFGADLGIYRPRPETPKEKAVCFIYQPEKPRRCPKIGGDALFLLHQAMPDVTIYTYGTRHAPDYSFPHTHLGLLSRDQCAELYNRCAAGFCISSTNPSRIPFEMMACGLPVVDFHGDNTVYDLPEAACLLARPDAASLAEAMLQLLRDEPRRQAMSEAGIAFMKDRPADLEFRQFLAFVQDLLAGRPVGSMTQQLVYQRPPVVAAHHYQTTFTPTEAAPPVQLPSLPRRAIRRFGRAWRVLTTGHA
jgi:hypothetical protein